MHIIGATCDINEANDPLAEMQIESMKVKEEAVDVPADPVIPEPFLFNTNKGVVNDILQSLTLNGPMWSWINAFRRI